MNLIKISAELDAIADEIQPLDPVLAYVIDRVTDSLIASSPNWMAELEEILKKNGIPEDKQKKIKQEILEVRHPDTGKFVPMTSIPSEG